MGKSSRRKGANYEREMAALFRELGWPDAKRHLEYQSDEAEEGRCLLYTSPSPRDQRGSRMPSSA